MRKQFFSDAKKILPIQSQAFDELFLRTNKECEEIIYNTVANEIIMDNFIYSKHQVIIKVNSVVRPIQIQIPSLRNTNKVSTKIKVTKDEMFARKVRNIIFPSNFYTPKTRLGD